MAPDTAPKLKGTSLIHGDSLVKAGLEVAPSISVSTSGSFVQYSEWDDLLNYRLPTFIMGFFFKKKKKRDVLLSAFLQRKLEESVPPLEVDFRNPPAHIYSRYTQGVSTRVEHILSTINVCSYFTFCNQWQPLSCEMQLTYPYLCNIGWICLDLFIWPSCFICGAKHLLLKKSLLIL